MLKALIALGTGALLVTLARRADARLPPAERLPMQWSLTGSVNWTAPRRIALAAVPVLGTLALAAVAFHMEFSAPRADKEGQEVPAMLALAAAAVGSYLLHLKLIAWTLRRR